MNDEQVIGIMIIGIVIAGIGVVVLMGTTPMEITTIDFTMSASGNIEDVAYGQPEHGFWGEENGAIDWNQLPLSWSWYSYGPEDEKLRTYEFWFRERWFNSTEWVYSNHGPFFVEYPQLEYYREISLNNHTVFIQMEVQI